MVPKLNPASERALVKTLKKGRRLGNRGDVFAKVGDSISESPAFLPGTSCGQWRFGSRPRLRRTLKYFAARTLEGSSACGRSNSFSRVSAATLKFASSVWALDPGASPNPACEMDEAPLSCEIRLVKPAYVLILFGTNDVSIGVTWGSDPLSDYLANIDRMIAASRRMGSAPVLTTIPPRNDSPQMQATTEALNAGLHRLAGRRRVPVINLWRALDPLPNRGLSADDLHPSLYGGPECMGICDPSSCAPVCRAGDLTAPGLRYGYNMRNLITLTTLRRLSRIARRHLAGQRARG